MEIDREKNVRSRWKFFEKQREQGKNVFQTMISSNLAPRDKFNSNDISFSIQCASQFGKSYIPMGLWILEEISGENKNK